ncbi:hypothetical protein ACIQW9_02570 [Herminiimonas sp. NPDC097707]|uniref:hypothetical protein n=1 Tax=Herminiimonas sp. NPDC097707 TaxID=3364007 RepID=UPI00383B3CA3
MRLVHEFKKRLQRQLVIANAPLERLAERQVILQALAMAKANRARQKIQGLQEVEFCAFSQWGEDGIIDWLIEVLQDIPHSFIEFGVGDYRESNTRLLLQLRNWRGLILDGSADHIEDIQGQELYWRHELQAKRVFIDRDNINQLIENAGFSGDVGLLSVDIDGNDYWVWQAITVVNPAIVVCEYNAVFGDLHQLTVPYRSDFQRANAHHSLLYFGASLQAMIALGKAKGYAFVGTASNGCNAFFVRNDLSVLVTDKLDRVCAFPSAAREARDAEGCLMFIGGPARADLIKELPIVNLSRSQTGELVKLGHLGELYSEKWLAGLGAVL